MLAPRVDTDRLAYWAGGQALPLASVSAHPNPYAEVLSTFLDWPEPVRRTLAASSPSAVRQLAIYDLDPSPRWFRGGVLRAWSAGLPLAGGALEARAVHLSGAAAGHVELLNVPSLFGTCSKHERAQAPCSWKLNCSR